MSSLHVSCVVLRLFIFQLQDTGNVIIESLNRINDWLSKSKGSDRDREGAQHLPTSEQRFMNQLFKQVVFIHLQFYNITRANANRIQFAIRCTQQVNGKLKSVCLIHFQCCIGIG